jgi:hypothetical protein
MFATYPNYLKKKVKIPLNDHIDQKRQQKQNESKIEAKVLQRS